MAKLTPKQQRFIEEYLIDLNASAAARRAGYSEKTAGAIGDENLKKPEIAAAIAERRAVLAQNAEITQEMIVAELAKIGFANMQDYMRVGADGDPYLDFSTLTRDQAAPIIEMVVEDFKDGRGEDARDVRRVRFKLSDKQAALINLGKHLGMFKDTLKIDMTGFAAELEAARRRIAGGEDASG
jgi:phage terminase small subunit